MNFYKEAQILKKALQVMTLKSIDSALFHIPSGLYSGLYISPGEPLSAEKDRSSPYFRIAQKTALSTLAAYVIFGPQFAICTALVNTILSLLTKDWGNANWFAKDRCIQGIKSQLSFFEISSNADYVYFMIEMLLKIPAGLQGFLIVMVNHFDQRRWGEFFKLYGYITLGAPLFEEIFFRGFFQEKIRDIQILLYKGDVNTSPQKVARVVLPTLVFTAMHYQPSLGMLGILINVTIFIGVFILGHSSGELKEKYSTLWPSITVHTAINFTASTRLLLASRFWKFIPWCEPPQIIELKKC